MPTVIGLKGTTGPVSVGSKVSWHPERLRRSLVSAVGPAATDFGRTAAAASPSRRVAASMFVRTVGDRSTVGFSHPLANIILKGAKPHIIGDVGQKLALKGTGRVVSGPVVHPGMKADTFLRDVLPLWAMYYRRRAAAATRVA